MGGGGWVGVGILRIPVLLTPSVGNSISILKRYRATLCACYVGCVGGVGGWRWKWVVGGFRNTRLLFLGNWDMRACKFSNLERA